MTNVSVLVETRDGEREMAKYEVEKPPSGLRRDSILRVSEGVLFVEPKVEWGERGDRKSVTGFEQMAVPLDNLSYVQVRW